MNSPLPYIDELYWATDDDPNKPPIYNIYDTSYNCGYYNTSYLGSRYLFPKTIIFCIGCGNYKHACNLNESNVKICDCKHIYPKNRSDWGFYIKKIYENMKLVHLEMTQKFKKEDMKKITELVVGIKTKSRIEWF